MTRVNTDILGISELKGIQFSCSVVSDSLQPYELQHARPPCPSPTPGVYSNSCPLSQWCHPTISSSVFPFSSCRQFPPASGSSPRNQFFTSGDQSIGALCYKVLCYKHKYTYNFILNQQPIKKCIPLCKAVRHMIPFPFTWNKHWTMNHTRTSERNQTQEETRSHLARLPWWLRW